MTKFYKTELITPIELSERVVLDKNDIVVIKEEVESVSSGGGSNTEAPEIGGDKNMAWKNANINNNNWEELSTEEKNAVIALKDYNL